MKEPDKPRISIVTPSYQQGEYLACTIESVLGQNYLNLEYIIVDGGSTDGSLEIIQKYAKHITHYVSEPDGGQADAICKGFDRATGDILAWLNSDDTYVPGALHKVGEFFLQNPSIGFLYGDYNLIDESGKLLETKRQPSFDIGIARYAYMTIPQQAAFWRKEVYRGAGGINSKFKFAMDYDLFLRMAQITKVQHVQSSLANYRVHSRSKTTTMQHVRHLEEQTIRMDQCRVKPTSWLHKLAKYYYMMRLIGKCLKEGCLSEKVINQVRRFARALIKQKTLTARKMLW